MINGDKGGEANKPEKGYTMPDAYKKPRTLTCCVCGREFGLTSLKIHYPKCSEKFINAEKLKSKADRKAVPKFSEDQLEMINEKDDWTAE